jgi:18S rRNA (guanine1575-N7)-methyltransferase
MARPEHLNPPDIFYNDTEAKKYATSNRMQAIQTLLSERAIELLNFSDDSPKLLLDIGCGTGLSGKVLEKKGHTWIGCDISKSMLDVGRAQNDVKSNGDTFVLDMGIGMPFRSGTFDGCISISALQWLCNSDSSEQKPVKRINRFFLSLYLCMIRGARCIFQFYPENTQQMELLTSAALRSGFVGGVLVDYPNSAKAKKYFLVLTAGQYQGQKKEVIPQALSDENHAEFENTRTRDKVRRSKQEKEKKGSKEWIKSKNERRQKQGKNSRDNMSKYSGQKRKPSF